MPRISFPPLTALRQAALAAARRAGPRRLRRFAAPALAAAALLALLTPAGDAPTALAQAPAPRPFVAFGPQSHLRGSGAPVTTSGTFAVQNPAAAYTLRVDNGGGGVERVSSASVRLNGVEVVRPSDLDQNTAVVTRSVSLLASNSLATELRSRPGSGLTLQVIGLDTDLPEIAASVEPPANAAGWHRADVTVRFACRDRTSGVATCPPPVRVTTEGANQVVAGTAVDKAGHTTTVSVTVSLDRTPPFLSRQVEPPASPSGWHSAEPTVRFAATDALSGVADVTGPVTVADEGAGQTIVGTATDLAGNRASLSVAISLDRTAPSVAVERSPAPNPAGWNSGDVTARFVAADALSGLDGAATTEVVFAQEGAGQSASRSFTDRAGNRATGTIAGVDIDRTAPSLTIASPAEGAVLRLPRVNLAGEVADALAGLAEVTCGGLAAAVADGAFACELPLVEGANALVVRATDDAGNARSATVNVTYVPAPVVRITAPSHLSVHNTSPVLVEGTVDRPVASVLVNGVAATLGEGSFRATVPLHEGNNTLSAVARDAHGNVGTGTVPVALDTTAPRLAVDSPRADLVTTAAAVDVSGSVNDTVVGTVNSAEVEVAVNGTPARVANRSFLLAGVPLAPGPNTILITARDRAGNSTTTAVTATRREVVGQPQLRLVSGSGQQAPIGAELPEPLVVALVDADGNPAPGKPVVFKVVESDGTLGGPAAPLRSVAVTSDAQGRAQARFTLGSRAGSGNNAVEAKATGFAGAALFSASGVSAPPAKINLDAGAPQLGAVGQSLPRPFVAVVTDAGHNRLPGVPVTFSVTAGGGSFNGHSTFTAESDSDGRALAVLTLGPAEGSDNNVVAASFPANPGSPAIFVASGRVAGRAEETSVSGVVLDNSNVPLKGAVIRLSGPTPISPADTIVTTTDAQGQFRVKPAPVGRVLVHVDGSGIERPGRWPDLEFDIVTVAGRDNTVGMPIYLLPLDTQNQLCVTESTGGTLTLPQVPGFSLTVAPGSATFPSGSRRGCVSVTPVHSDKVPMVPQFGQQPRFIVTVQPAGVEFATPAALTIPNVDGLRPGEVTEMYSFDHDLGQFVSIGTGTVSADGAVVRSDPGIGIIKGGWHCGGNPSSTGSAENATVSVAPTQATLVPDETATVVATGAPLPSGTPAYSWSSANPAIATVAFAPGNNAQSHPNSVVVTGVAEGTTTITVTYRCESGATATAQLQVTVLRPEIKLEKVGQSTIDPANSYSENTVLRATVVYPPGHPRAGQTVTTFTGDITFAEEAGTTYYNGANGASTLPTAVAAAAGVASTTIRSVSNADVAAGPVDARIRATSPNANQQAATNPLSVDQWVDENGNGFIDWLDRQSRDRLAHFQGRPGIVGAVANLVSNIVQSAGGCGSTPIDQTVIGVGPVCGSPNRHRRDVARELSDTVIHEARHVWQHAQENVALGTGAAPTNDSDRDHCPEAVPAGSEAGAGATSPIVDGTAPTTGDNTPNLPYGAFCQPIFEADASQFGVDHRSD